MITIIRSEEREYADVKDQKTWKTFGPENKPGRFKDSFGVLKILNEEILSPGGGFTLHTKKDMVVVTYVRDGMIVYKCHLEEPVIFEMKEFGRNNADKETTQYAFNTSETEEAHIFQCGFNLDGCADACGDDAPKTKGVKKLFTHAERQGVLKLIASGDGKDDSLPIQQDVQIYSSYTRDGNHIVHELKPNRSAWFHVVKGEVLHNKVHLRTGDGAGLTEETAVSFTSKGPAEILIFDLCETKAEEKEHSPSERGAVATR